MIYNRKKTVQKYPLLMPIKFLYNSKFDFTANSLVTNTVVIVRVLCICIRGKLTNNHNNLSGPSATDFGEALTQNKTTPDGLS